MANTIVLKGDPLQKERAAGGAITPGHLCLVNSLNKIVVHPTAGGNFLGAVAIEDALQGRDIDDAYASGEVTQYVVVRPGDEFTGIFTTSQVIFVGDVLERAGNGTVSKHTPPTESTLGVYTATTMYHKAIIGRALEAVTTTGATARIQIEAC